MQLHELSGLGTPVGPWIVRAVFQLVVSSAPDFEHPFEATHLTPDCGPSRRPNSTWLPHLVLDPDAYSAPGRVFVRGGGGVGLQPGERLSAQGPWLWDAPKPDYWQAYPGG